PSLAAWLTVCVCCLPCSASGQAYVALSRVRSLEGLLLSGFSRAKIRAHPKVVEFYRSLSKDEDSKEASQLLQQAKQGAIPNSSNSNSNSGSAAAALATPK